MPRFLKRLFKKILKRKKKNKQPLKEVKNIIFDIDEVIEDTTDSFFDIKENFSYYKLLQTLNEISENKIIKKVIIDIDRIYLSMTHLEEISKIFDKIRKNKEVIAIGSFFNEKIYRYALLADKIFMLDSRQSMFYFRGYSVKEHYYKSILSKLGIEMNVLNIGNYKVLGENYIHDEMTEEKKESIKNVKEKLFQDFIKDVKSKRGVDIENEILNGELIFANKTKALKFNLIDGVSDYDEAGIVIKNDTMSIGKFILKCKDKKNKSKNKIAVINLEGEIDGDFESITYKSVCEKLNELEDFKSLKGIVLRINSPGGNSLETEKIYRKLKNQKIPIYVSMGDYCASGGYYIATVGKKIFANNSTVTGSIGVILMYPEYSGIIGKLGIRIDGFEKGKGFDIFNSTEKLSENSRERILYSMKETYEEFKERVMKSRGISEEAFGKIAEGRVWMGSEAKKMNLIDEIGTLEDCISAMAKDLQLDKYEVVNVEKIKSFSDSFEDMEEISLFSQKTVKKLNFIRKNINKMLYYENSFIKE